MTEVISKEQCTGCGACMNVCPKGAISMQADAEGFDQPHIDSQCCIDCGLCQQSCPVLHASEHNYASGNTIQQAFAARNSQREERMVSSSGGVFAVLARQVLAAGGAVVGVAYDAQFDAEWRIIENADELPLLQGSKYLQCRVDDQTFAQVKQLLQTGRKVLFSGMACQVEGLKSYLRKDYEHLYCADLICMGIPSARVWQQYLGWRFAGEQIMSVNFKEKGIGWKQFRLAIDTDQQQFREIGMKNAYLQSMFKGFNMRRSCFNCPFKRLERAADFTLADCWGAFNEVPALDDNRGLSSVIVHSEKGLALWLEAAAHLESQQLPIDTVVAGNRNMVEHKQLDAEGREQFYRLLSEDVQKAFNYSATYQPVPTVVSIPKKHHPMIDRLVRWLTPSRWHIDKQLFHELYDYDLQYNAAFRGLQQLRKEDLQSDQMLYIKLYRQTQAAWHTNLRKYYLRKLKRFGRQTGIQLHDHMGLPKGLIIGHTGTIVINEYAQIAGNLFVTHGVTIGRDIRGKRAGAPTIGKNVCIRCNSTVVGGITIGDDVLIAPNTFVNFDVPSHSVVIGNPATIHPREHATEGHLPA